MNCKSLLPLAVPALTGLLTAQIPSDLIGITRLLPALRQVSHAPCQRLGQCALPLPAVAIPSAGGTAWDPTSGGAWVSNGLVLAQFDATCGPLCPPAPIPTLLANAFVSGLEYSERLDELQIIDTAGFFHRYTNACPPMPIQVCQTGLMPAGGFVTSGLATDEDLGLVFIAYANQATGANLIAVSRLNTPCQVVCQIPVPACAAGFAALKGLACDWGNRILYGTDGSNTIALRYAPVATTGCVGFTGVSCCVLPAAPDPMTGLAIRPGGATHLGQPCANGACTPCPMRHELANDPSLGNADFRLTLDDAPTGSLAWAVIGTGPCSMPGVSVPLLCGPIYAAPVLGTLGPNLTGGVGPCGGSTTFALPLPPDAALAGWVMSSQCVALCVSTTSIGTAISNCLSFELQGN